MGELLELLDMKVLVIFMTAVLLLFLILVIVLWSKLNKLRKQYMNMLNGGSDLNVEEALIRIQEQATVLEAEYEKSQQQIAGIMSRMKKMKSNVGVYRYNAFAQNGSDLSFSVAVLDDELDGVVLTGIHNREETYVYAKPVSQGQSEYVLSPEEKEAIHRVGQKK
ncbi:hypothetical protein SK3146_03756 [Paenibacillus konkukensis]|uniref:DUF4446 domain-containing protein n=1 Tax=Paenibacillus konkukensis TaxID=2020716 RepID=A0ABY4RSY8_9BACL|nr:DUF4446 family protein [Paenibacillus konkukensis]UQZ84502.1 hypothetical protein SK3146_03756 [Paenibacillus konkukensis]